MCLFFLIKYELQSLSAPDAEKSPEDQSLAFAGGKEWRAANSLSDKQKQAEGRGLETGSRKRRPKKIKKKASTREAKKN